MQEKSYFTLYMGQSLPKKKRKNYSDLRKKRLIKLIIARMSDGLWLRKACRLYDVKPSTALLWVDVYNLSEQYARAKEESGLWQAEDMIEMVDEVPPTDAEGRVDRGYLEWRRQRIDTRKWLMSKITKQFSERKDVNLSGELNTKTTIVPTFKQFVESNVKAG